MLTMFTFPKGFDDEHVSRIQHNALGSWVMMQPEAEIIVVGDDPGVQEAARHYGLKYCPTVDKNENGP